MIRKVSLSKYTARLEAARMEGFLNKYVARVEAADGRDNNEDGCGCLRARSLVRMGKKSVFITPQCANEVLNSKGRLQD